MGSLQLLCTITHLLGEPHPQYDPKAIGAPIDPQNSCHHANKAHQAKDSLRKITLWLVVSIPLKNMSSSVGMIVPFPTEWKVIIKPIKFPWFQTTNQSFVHVVTKKASQSVRLFLSGWFPPRSLDSNWKKSARFLLIWSVFSLSGPKINK